VAYVFDPSDLGRIARANIGCPRKEMFEAIKQELDALFPGRIDCEAEWILNNAGGAMGTMAVLYASLREYVILFGTPIGNQGHTGRFSFVEDWFWILEGELWYFSEGRTEREVYTAGDEVRLARKMAKAYRIVDNAWALEYARGWIPTMLPFGLCDTMFSTTDYRTFLKTLRIYAKHVARNAWRPGGRARRTAGGRGP